MPKRFGIADFFTRSLFSRKSKEPKAASHNATGWRLFGKTAATAAAAAGTSREVEPTKDSTPSSSSSTTTEQETQDRDAAMSSGAQRPLAAGRRKNLEFEPLSTTALILEDRPANLPAKSEEETQRHKLEYEEMVAGAKRRELKEAQKKKRQMKERHRQEDSISNAMVVWNNEILPHWDSMKGTRRVRELWWQGLPPASEAECGASPSATSSTSLQSCMRSSCAEPKRSGGATVKPAQSTTVRATEERLWPTESPAWT
ncbi:hypothetical protein INR49_009455 [Caranx melampygus]|nr:hypothetical protein INR49_009455 [Caranx melampygus]